MKPIDLIKISDFSRFIIYGEKKLPIGNIHWHNVRRLDNGYYDYCDALSQVTNNYNIIDFAYMLNYDVIHIESFNRTLYICIELVS